MSKLIALTRGLSTIVDDEDYEWLSQWKWRVAAAGSKPYAGRSAIPPAVPKATTILMHRLITGASKGLVVDHINGDSLDNRRVNLRVCTHTENCQNRVGRIAPRSSPGVKGVIYIAGRGKWRASYRSRYIGYFDTELEASNAYDAVVLAAYPDFARPNNLGGTQCPAS